MRPKLKPDVYWVPHPDGLTFLHPNGYLNIKGGSALALMDRLAPYLDGRVTLDELVSDLPEGKKEMVTTLVTALHGAGFVKDTTGDRPHQLTNHELAIYAAEIAYIDYYLDSAAWRFQRYRETSVVCVGAGLTLAALAHACLRSGQSQITAFVSGECATDLDRLDDYARLAAARDPAQRFARRALDPGPEGLRTAVEAGQVVLHVSDCGAAERARDLDRLCRELDRLLVQGVMASDTAWTGPLAGARRPGWESVWRRLAANTPRPAGVDPFAVPDAAPSPYLAGPTAGIVANRVSFLAFRHLTGISEVDPVAPDPAGQHREAASRVDLETLQTSDHRCHPHPGSRGGAGGTGEHETEAEFADRYAAFSSATASDGDAFSASAAGYFDPYLGIFAELDEEEMPQLPLFVSRTTVSDPFGLLDTSAGPLQVIGAGTEFGEARRASATAAFAAYAALAVDRSRLHQANGAGQRAFAHNLVLDKPELIDAQRAYPALAAAGTPASTFHSPPGLAAGADASVALARGLLDHCVALTAAAAAAATRSWPGVDVGALPLDERGARYREILRVADVTLELYNVTGPLGVPVGLERVVLDYQRVTDGRPVPQLPAAVRGATGAAPGLPDGLPAWHDLAEALYAQGYQVHALPAGHDPAATWALPTLVQVVVGD